ncbi:uncharacterized protein [Battus philenor]|uniref:uncharacterized protein n=1 Tax=Battus philenor TaxID=42288 RepID=UPI0035D0620C
MICIHCRNTLKNGEGIKCSECDSKYHLKCVKETDGVLESGDLGYHWTCALCKHPAGKSDQNLRSSSSHVVTAMNTISEKFELVNKIQLPRLSVDILHIKNTAERIAKQNESILRSIEELKAKRDKVRLKSPPLNCYRRRHLNLIPKIKTSTEVVQKATAVPVAEKVARYKTRRRSNTLHEMFLSLNKKLHQPSVVSK